LFSYISVEERIPADHPLRRVKAQADAVLGAMNAALDRMYADCGVRPPSFDSSRSVKVFLVLVGVHWWQ
jgi:hypothetical protein